MGAGRQAGRQTQEMTTLSPTHPLNSPTFSWPTGLRYFLSFHGCLCRAVDGCKCMSVCVGMRMYVCENGGFVWVSCSDIPLQCSVVDTTDRLVISPEQNTIAMDE
mmetsp:Transcript_16361/g.46576  ORF Transcript_16361/g.46576 Transcript_16361/m.46576 type:complete len:105 (-) Transcript_16361:61-375(-)